MKLVRFLLLCALMLVQPAFAQNARDGNWWRSLEQRTQRGYVLGVFDGMLLGHSFTTWKLAEDKNSADALAKANAANQEYMTRYLRNVSASQIADGLDEFYSDSRNRRIPTHGAIWLVLAQIAGDPDVQTMIDGWRNSVSR